MTVIGRIKGPYHAFEIVERMQFSDLFRPDQFNVEAKRTPHGQGMAQPIHLILGIGKTEGSAAMPRDGLAGHGLKPARIQPDVVVHAFAQPE